MRTALVDRPRHHWESEASSQAKKRENGDDYNYQPNEVNQAVHHKGSVERTLFEGRRPGFRIAWLNGR
jgi:hypothetical protein